MPGRQTFRLASLVVALGVVTMLVAVLQKDETAAKVDQAFGVSTVSDLPLPLGEGRGEGASYSGNAASFANDATDARSDPTAFRKILELAGWGTERFARFGDGQPLDDSQREELLDLLRRLRTFDAADIAAWSAPDVTLAALTADPDKYRGQLVRLVGRAIRVTRRTLPPELAARLEMPAYIECEIAVDGGGTATVITARVPKVWTEMNPLAEPAETDGVFVKLLPAQDGTSNALFVSRDIAWRPVEPREPFVSRSNTQLSHAGMDIGLLDQVQQRRPILGNERDAFYSMLAAARNAGASQLARWAQENLPAVRTQWAALQEKSAESNGSDDRKRLLLAREVVSRADEGRYSVAPLFNEPAEHVGDLVMLDGLARRATRIDVGTLPDGRPSEVARRFGIDHYYELEIFTDDSQDNPIVFCATYLPAGFPLGESIREQVRVAGFFFKSWSFESRRAAQPRDDENSATPAAARQFAPLVIGREPIWIQPAHVARPNYSTFLLAGLFAALLAGVWIVGWWLARDDRRFGQKLMADRFTLPPGESLNNLQLPAAESEKLPPK